MEMYRNQRRNQRLKNKNCNNESKVIEEKYLQKQRQKKISQRELENCKNTVCTKERIESEEKQFTKNSKEKEERRKKDKSK